MTTNRSPLGEALSGHRQAPTDPEWEDPLNWHADWLGISVAPKDPRLVVRKRQPELGWTLNFAHTLSWLLVVAGLLLFAAVMALAS